MMKRLFVTPLALLLFTAYSAVGQTHQGVTGGNGFIENQGQWADEVLFMTSVESGRAWVTQTGIVYDFFEVERGESPPSGPNGSTDVDLPGPRRAEEPDDGRVRGHVVRLAFEGGTAQAVQPENALTTRLNYFLGDDPARYASNVPVYEAVTLRGLYAGVDLRLESDTGGFRLSFQADDAAALAAVRLGTTAGDVIQRGEAAVVTTNLGDRTLGAMRVEMRRRAETGLYVARINGGTVEPGRVQPVQGRQQPRGTTVRAGGGGLLYSTFPSSVLADFGTALIVDASGAAYVTGQTSSPDFPTTPGAYDTIFSGIDDAFVAKLSPDGSTLEYATFLGGGGPDGVRALALDTSGAAYITGQTYSPDFPTTPDAYDETYNGESSDAFVAKLSPDGSALEYSTFLGGGDTDVGSALALDTSGAAYVTGQTYSPDFPTTPGAYDETYNGGVSDAFVAKLSPDGSALEYATFLGGTGVFSATGDFGSSVAVDATGRVIVTGSTPSEDFPVTPGAFGEINNGYWDAFVVRLSADGAALDYATFLGGNNLDYGYALALDASGAAYVTGQTRSSDFPTTPGAYDGSYNGSEFSGDAFVAKLSADGSALEYATFLGGSEGESGNALVVDANGAAYVAGATASSDFPTTPGAYDETYNGGVSDAFVAKLAPDGSALEYATFLGGSEGESGNALMMDASGAAYVAGSTASSDFPTTPGAYDTSHNGDRDAFVTKLSPDGSALEYSTFLGGGGNSDQPDLVPLNLAVSPAEGPAGSSATVSFTVQNQGGADAPATQTNVRISTSDTDVTVDDPLLVTLSTPVLGAGASEDYVEEVVVPEGLPEGAYHVWVITDVNSEAGQENESNDKAHVPFDVGDGEPSPVFVYRTEFNQGAQDSLVIPEMLAVGDLDIPLIPGRETIVRYYLFGESGPRENYTATLRVTSDVWNMPRTIEPNARYDEDTAYNSVDVPADPGPEGTAREAMLLDQRRFPEQSLNFVVPGVWTLEADELTFELVDGNEVLATADVTDLQDNRTTLVLDVWRVENASMNACSEGVWCSSDNALTREFINERVIPYVQSALPFSEIDILYKSFPWNGSRWYDIFVLGDENDCVRLLADLDDMTLGEYPLPRIPSNSFHWTKLAVVLNLESCGGRANRPGNNAISAARGEAAAHEIGHNIGLKHASTAHGELGENGNQEAEPWNMFPHGLMGAGIHEFGAFATCDSCGDTEEDAGEWTMRVVDPCPGYTYAERLQGENGACPIEPEEANEDGVFIGSVAHDFMSYASNTAYGFEYFGELESNLANGNWISPRNYRRLYRAVRYNEPLYPNDPARGRPVASRSESMVLGGEALVPAFVVTGIVAESGEGAILPLLQKDVPEDLLGGDEDGTHTVELSGSSGEVLVSIPVKATEYADGSLESQIFQTAVPYVEGVTRAALVEEGTERAVRTASPATPEVQVLSPNGGEVYAEQDSVAIAWEASDADGDSLHVIVQHSADSGVTWSSLALLGPGDPPTFTLAAGDLQPGDEGLLRVSVSDGLNTAEDVSDGTFTIGDVSTSTDDDLTAPEGYALEAPFPNPTNGDLVVPLVLPEAADIQVVLYDVLGREVAVIADGRLQAGRHHLPFDAGMLPSGMYLVSAVVTQGAGIPTQLAQRVTIVR